MCNSESSLRWTYDTRLMDQSNIIVQGIEMHGVHTFSAKEMVFNILGLMHLILFSITQVEPVWGNLSGCYALLWHFTNRYWFRCFAKDQLVLFQASLSTCRV